MKVAIALLSLVVSANVFAYSLADSTVLTSASPFLSSATTSAPAPEKQAAIVVNDAQDLIQTGSMSPFLGQKIREVQMLEKGASVGEALDMLLEEASSILNK